MMKTLFVVALALVSATGASKLALTPPMGWMSWEIFRCDIDCNVEPEHCINADLYKTMTDALVAGGFLDAGYDGIHLDDCWMQMTPPRDPVTNQLVPDTTRFPLGFKDLGDYMHKQGVKFAIYTAESPTTCAGYPASAGHEALDAATFAGWGVDYVKVDGCGDNNYYPTGYPLMGNALTSQNRSIVYSCSWPAYLGTNESTKPYPAMIAAHCNLWRNWDDIQCNWGSLASIIDHWGDYGPVLQQFAAPGHWNDPDMLLIGNGCINNDEERTQMAIWSIVAAPLIMGNDVRNISVNSTNILLNREAIAIDQDPLGQQGLRISPKGPQEVWARNLSDGSVAVALYNKLGASSPLNCVTWNMTQDGYYEACGGSSGDENCFTNLSLDQALDNCCKDPSCASISFEAANGSGCYKLNTDCGFVSDNAYAGYAKPNFVPPAATSAKITVRFADVGLSGPVKVRDIWANEDLGVFQLSYSAIVPFHGTAFLKLTPA